MSTSAYKCLTEPVGTSLRSSRYVITITQADRNRITMTEFRMLHIHKHYKDILTKTTAVISSHLTAKIVGRVQSSFMTLPYWTLICYMVW